MTNRLCGPPSLRTPVTLTFDLLTSKLLSQLLLARVGKLSSKFKHCTVLRFRVDDWHGTDRQTDERNVARNAAS